MQRLVVTSRLVPGGSRFRCAKLVRRMIQRASNGSRRRSVACWLSDATDAIAPERKSYAADLSYPFRGRQETLTDSPTSKSRIVAELLQKTPEIREDETAAEPSIGLTGSLGIEGKKP